jgi:hypothetical protein
MVAAVWGKPRQVWIICEYMYYFIFSPLTSTVAFDCYLFILFPLAQHQGLAWKNNVYILYLFRGIHTQEKMRKLSCAKQKKTNTIWILNEEDCLWQLHFLIILYSAKHRCNWT